MQHLDEYQVKDLLYNRESDIIQQMEDVFKDYGAGIAEMVPKIYLDNRAGDFRAMPARWGDYSGVKWISVYPNNRKHNLPTIHGTLLLNDTYTGKPLISMDCAELTAYRTAAVSALAAKHLTMSGIVRTLTFIGCGKQALTHFRMYDKVFNNINSIKLYDKYESSANSLAEAINDQYPSIDIKVYDSVRNACGNADVITTLTPSTEGFLGASDIEHPFHINAVGADAVGKRELSNSIWMDCFLIVDDYEQASHSGEMQYKKNLPYLTLSDIISDDCIKPRGKTTVFDSTGLAIQDIAIGRFIYEEYNRGN